MTRALLRGIFALSWLVVIPFGAAISYGFVHDAWTLEETHRQYWWIAGGALIWLAGAPLLPMPANPTPWIYAGLALWAILSGAVAGSLALDILNSVGNSSPGEVVEVEATKYQKGRVRFRVSPGPHEGTEFAVTNGKWGAFDGKRRTFVMHRGRLGLWWGELK